MVILSRREANKDHVIIGGKLSVNSVT